MASCYINASIATGNAARYLSFVHRRRCVLIRAPQLRAASSAAQGFRRRSSIANVASETQVAVTPLEDAAATASAISITFLIKKQPRKLTDIFGDPDPRGDDIVVQLVSREIDPSIGKARRSHKFPLTLLDLNADNVKYTANIKIEAGFGTPGAVVVVNKHNAEIFLETVLLEGLPGSRSSLLFSCYSWIHSLTDSPAERVFFSNEAFLPGSTPPGLKDLREAELRSLQGDGTGKRQRWERIYDYDVYNDLGVPEKNMARPTAGGEAIPYPRRCRTGRAPSQADRSAESRISPLKNNYVPRDEDFEKTKSTAFTVGRLKAIALRVLPSIVTHFTRTPDEFDNFTDIDLLYYQDIPVTANTNLLERIKDIINFSDDIDKQIKFPQCPLFEKDKFAWTRDAEFGRQMLAGLDPLRVEALTVFPPVSRLDSKVHGPLDSAFKAEELEKYLDGMSLQQALDAKKLFIVDYHDIFLPLIASINATDERKGYATRTIFFLDNLGLFRPVGIELSLPPYKDKPEGYRKAFYPDRHANAFWLWQQAKAHVCSSYSSYHQVVTHWLQTHACVEPYVIATNRQLSAMHPVAKLLHPHLRYTMQVNSTARQTLISAGGVIEKCFTTGLLSLNLSAAGYSSWRFDKQGLPADLLNRGMAVEDESSPSGVKLVIEDYPYAADGLLIWSALKSYVSTFLAIFYDEPDSILKDTELQAWWNEIQTKGHADKKEGWPKLETRDDLVEILTSIMWVTSGHHAAVNFGQFLFSGYMPNMPSVTRKLIPEAGDPDYKEMLDFPQRFMLKLLPNQTQASTVMAVVQLLSTHHPDEEYLGERGDPNWINNEQALMAAKTFKDDIDAVEEAIHCRNRDPNLKHRYGAGIVSYELLLPYSGPGVTAKGVPNSISI